MSRQQITNHYARLLTRWPTDRLRETHFQTILKARLQAPPNGQRNEEQEVNAAYLLLHNAFAKQNPMPSNLSQPKSNPGHYTTLVKELDEAPDRSWFANAAKRMRNMFRMQ